MAVYHIESITIRDKSVVPVRVQWPVSIDYQSTNEVTGDQEVVTYKGEALGVDQSSYFLRMRMDDGTLRDLRNSDIVSVFQEYEVETGSTIYWGASLVPPPTLGKLTDVYIAKNGDCYSLTENGWVLQTNIRGPRGPVGATPSVGVNGNWFINGKDTGISAKGNDGVDGASPVIDPTTKHWFLKGVDLGVCAEGHTPYIGTNGNWFIGTTDTGVLASGNALLPAIDPTSKHWIINGVDSGVKAEGVDGKSPTIDPASKHWFIDGVDTGVIAEGAGLPVNLTINSTTKNWEIDGVDTGVPATGPQGPAGKDGKDGESFQLYAVYTDVADMNTDEPSIPENSFVALVTDTNVKIYIKSHGYVPAPTDSPESMNNFIWIKNLTDAVQIAGTPGKDGQTPHIDPTTKHWVIGTIDTGVSAEPLIPYVGTNGNWMVGLTDTGVSAKGTAGTSPHIDPTTKHWMIGTFDTGVVAEAPLPSIHPTTFNWVINGTDTGISAKGADGLTPYIGGNGHWFVGATDTGVNATGAFPVIDATTKHWFIDGKDTGVSAVGPAGTTPTIAIDPTTKNWMINGLDSGVCSVGATGAAPTIGANGNWWIGTTDTGVSAKGTAGTTPHIDPTSKHWMIGTTDTGVLAEAKVDKADIEALKQRMNSLIASKHSLGSCDYFFAYGSPKEVTLGGPGVSLLQYFDKVTKNMDYKSNYVTLRANRTYKITASVMSAGSKQCRFNVVDRAGTQYGSAGNSGALNGWYDTPSCAVVAFNKDTEITVVTRENTSGQRIAPHYSYVLIEEINNPKDIDPVEYIMHKDGIEDNPVGTIIPYMGTVVPKHYLPCDGAEYNIDDYPDLAAHFTDEFGAAEYFGGDGITTFKVPDLRGEFLRGTGTNGHTSMGDGAAVGVHQDGSIIPEIFGETHPNGNYYLRAILPSKEHLSHKLRNADSIFSRGRRNISTKGSTTDTSVSDNNSWISDCPSEYTTRPTNTSVMWCIKYEKTPFLQIGSNTDVSKDADNQLEQRSDGLYVPKSLSDVSKDADNLIEVRKDGIYADVPISGEPDNGLEKKSDGFFVENVPEELRLKVNLLSRAKHTTEEVQFFFATKYMPDIPQSAEIAARPKITDVTNLLTVLPSTTTNMEVTSDSFVKLLANRTYSIEACSLINHANQAIVIAIVDGNGDMVGAKGYQDGKDGPYGYGHARATITPETDMLVCAKIGVDGLQGKLTWPSGVSMVLADDFSYVFIQEINNAKEIDPVEYVMGKDGIEASPVGNIISYMGNNPPKHYLACDGTEYQISDYAQLAQHFIDEFGEVNYFGGDGVDTFCVPDLRGEFLRGSGDNSHTGQGQGDDVGIHQDATSMPHHWTYYSKNTGMSVLEWPVTNSSGSIEPENMDSVTDSVQSPYYKDAGGQTSTTRPAGVERTLSYTARPTNTSVLWCIKYESTPFVQIGGSTDLKIDPDTDNAIEERPDGLFVPKGVNVSKEAGNGIEQKADGIYVESHDEMKKRINQLLVSKHSEIESDWLFVTDNAVSSPEINVSTDDSLLSVLPNVMGTMSVTDDGFIVLPANKTYKLSAQVVTNYAGDDGAVGLAFVDRTGAVYSAKGRAYAKGTDSSAMTMISVGETPMEVKPNVMNTSNCTIHPNWSYVTVEEIGCTKIIDPIEWTMKEGNGIEDSPVGNIISYMGTTPPKHYLVCDGSEYNIADYPFLAEHFRVGFGATNYFGGDGIDTFCVPDLMGEFLRGAGDNSRSGQGSGAGVGEHQDATTIPRIHTRVTPSGSGLLWYEKNKESKNNDDMPMNTDAAQIQTSNDIWQPCFSSSTHANASGWGINSTYASYATRPTNTSVLWCIKAEPTPFVQIVNGTASGPIKVDPDKDNAIEERADGLFVPKGLSGVSAESDNAIVEKNDGIFVHDYASEINDVSDRVNSIKRYQRYLNTELEFCDLTRVSSSTINIPVGQPFVFDKCRAVNDMEYDLSNGSIVLKADKTYEIVYDIYCAATNIWGLYGLYNVTDATWLDSTMMKINHNCSSSTAGTTTGHLIITPDHDIRIQVRLKKVSTGSNQGTDSNGVNNSHFTVKEIGRTTVIDPVEWTLKDGKGIEDNPVGTIMSYMGTTPPKHYLACDGAEYNIADYPALSDHFISEYGSVNYFGGDGVNTFKVPDLRGEFLRGSTDASQSGTHQDATMIPYTDGIVSGSTPFIRTYMNSLTPEKETGVSNQDSQTKATGLVQVAATRNTDAWITANGKPATIATRPTNTSVMYCIKYECTPFLQIGGSGSTDISSDADNQIEQRADGLYVPKSKLDEVSAEDGNIADVKNDGLYVPEVTEYAQNTRKIANFARTAKLSRNENMDYLFVSNKDGTTIPALTVDTPVNVFKTVHDAVGVSIDTDTGIVQIRGGKTYEISVQLGTSFGSISATTQGSYGVYIRAIGETAWKFVGKPGFERLSTPPAQRYVSPAVAIVTPDVDSEISIQYRTAESESAYLARTNVRYSELSELKLMEIGRTVTIDPVSYVIETEGIEDSPVGNIISYMGVNVPKHYLACDGTEYPIVDYPELAEHFRSEFGSTNYFGGDGVDTFKVPDLRGEFLRGTGENGHTNQGGGSDVGEHQDATSLPDYSNSGNDLNGPCTPGIIANRDSVLGTASSSYYAKSGTYNDPGRIAQFTTRPTNTSVQYCIKYESTPVVQFVEAVEAEISNDADNAIVQKPDGLFVPATPKVTISQEDGNELEQKEDGLYIGSHDDLRKRINEIHAAKYTTKKSDWFYMVGSLESYTDSEWKDTGAVSVGDNIIEKLLPYSETKGTIKLTDDHYIPLRSNTTYRISLNLSTNVIANASTAIGAIVVDRAGNKYLPFSRDGSGNQVYDSDNLCCIIEVGEDPIEVKLDAPWVSPNTVLYYCSSYIIVEEFGSVREIDPVEWAMKDGDGIEDVPVGTITPFMGTVSPKHYLACDGAVYNIIDWPFLADHFKTAFGSVNHFGGDGVNTFAVPDLRGEFLRGAGSNSHSNQGSGNNVGVHQDATNHQYTRGFSDPNAGMDYSQNGPSNVDSTVQTRNDYRWVNADQSLHTGNIPDSYTSRPTNTSVLWCIKAEPTPYFQMQECITGVTINEVIFQQSVEKGKSYTLPHAPKNRYDLLKVSLLHTTANAVLTSTDCYIDPSSTDPIKVIVGDQYAPEGFAQRIRLAIDGATLTVEDAQVTSGNTLHTVIIRGIKYAKANSADVTIDPDETNALEERPTGLYVQQVTIPDPEISDEKDNALERKTDGLYVAAPVTYTDEEVEAAVMDVFYPTATSRLDAIQAEQAGATVSTMSKAPMQAAPLKATVAPTVSMEEPTVEEDTVSVDSLGTLDSMMVSSPNNALATMSTIAVESPNGALASFSDMAVSSPDGALGSFSKIVASSPNGGYSSVTTSEVSTTEEDADETELE